MEGYKNQDREKAQQERPSAGFSALGTEKATCFGALETGDIRRKLEVGRSRSFHRSQLTNLMAHAENPGCARTEAMRATEQCQTQSPFKSTTELTKLSDRNPQFD